MFLWVVLILVALGVVAVMIGQSMPRRTRIVERDVSPRDDEVVVERRTRRRGRR